MLGVTLAYYLGLKKLNVILLKQSDRLTPKASSLRNHGWLQSGLLYGPSMPHLATRMWVWGRRFLREFGVKPPEERGIFYCPPDEAADLCSLAMRLNIPIEGLRPHDLPGVLGPLYTRNTEGFWVPDAPFDEAGLITAIRNAARYAGGQMIDLDEPVHLIEHKVDECGVRSGDHVYHAGFTFICAGAGTPRLLEELSLQHPLAVYRSGLLRLPHFADIRTNLAVSYPSGLTLLHQPTNLTTSGKCTIAGNRDRLPVQANQLSHQLSPAELQSLLRSLPLSIRMRLQYADYPATACFKTEAQQNGTPSVEPWFEEIKPYKGLYAAVPGKATMALWTARETLKKAGITLHDEDVTVLAPATPATITNEDSRQWKDEIKMHWNYNLDDRAPAQQDTGT